MNLWIEGFESHLNTAQFQRKYATFSGTFVSKAGRVFGASAGPSSTVAVTPSLGTDNTFIIGMGFQFSAHNVAVNSGNQGFYVELGPDEQCHVEMESTSGQGVRFHIKRGSTTIDTSSYFDFGVWHYLEWKLVTRTGTNGAYELRHNGVQDITGTSVNLADTGGDGWDVFAFRFSSNLTNSVRLDDIYINNSVGSNNNDFLSPQIVEGLSANADGASSQWTQNGTGDHYTSIDDAGNANPDDIGAGGTIGSDTNGQIDLFEFEDLSHITGTINAVQLGIQLGMAATGSRTVRSKYRDPDTTVVNGSSHVVDSTTFDEFTETFDLNPHTAAAWDVTDIDDGQFGVEVVS